jgi:hypothetical protein
MGKFIVEILEKLLGFIFHNVELKLNRICVNSENFSCFMFSCIELKYELLNFWEAFETFIVHCARWNGEIEINLDWKPSKWKLWKSNWFLENCIEKLWIINILLMISNTLWNYTLGLVIGHFDFFIYFASKFQFYWVYYICWIDVDNILHQKL